MAMLKSTVTRLDTLCLTAATGHMPTVPGVPRDHSLHFHSCVVDPLALTLTWTSAPPGKFSKSTRPHPRVSDSGCLEEGVAENLLLQKVLR